MNPEKLSMLGPKSIKMEGVGGGIPDITPEDIAGAMRHLHWLEYDLLDVKYCGGSINRRGRIMSMVNGYFLTKFRKNDKEELARMANDVVNEYISPNRCPSCHGTKEAVIANKTVVCPDCNGTGFKYQSWGMHNHIRDRGWKFLQGIEARGLAKIEEIYE